MKEVERIRYSEDERIQHNREVRLRIWSWYGKYERNVVRVTQISQEIKLEVKIVLSFLRFRCECGNSWFINFSLSYHIGSMCPDRLGHHQCHGNQVTAVKDFRETVSKIWPQTGHVHSLLLMVVLLLLLLQL